MKLLIITQAVDRNDPILGFFHRWIEEFAKHWEEVVVICLREGEYDLPENVSVYSLGKEQGKNKLQILFNFYRLIFKLRKQYDSVFVHMNPEYVVLGGVFWRLQGKRVGLWYTHKSVDIKLRIAEKLTHSIFTASRESFRLSSKKVCVTGHGIDTDLFIPSSLKKTNKKTLLTVGRVSKTKHTRELIDVLATFDDAILHIVGAPVTPEDEKYYQECIWRAENLGVADKIVWHGNIFHREIASLYQKAHVFVNLSTTGSLDKAILEALSCEVPVVSSNEAVQSFPGVHVTELEEKPLREAIVAAFAEKENKIGRHEVVAHHSLGRLIPFLSELIHTV